MMAVTTRIGGTLKYDDEYEEIEPARPLMERVLVAEAEQEADEIEGEEDEARPARKPSAAQAKSVAFPADQFHGPWPLIGENKALVVKTVQFPPSLWAACLDLSILQERKGAAAVIRHAVALYLAEESQRDPRVAEMLRQHAALRTLGLEG